MKKASDFERMLGLEQAIVRRQRVVSRRDKPVRKIGGVPIEFRDPALHKLGSSYLKIARKLGSKYLAHAENVVGHFKNPKKSRISGLIESMKRHQRVATKARPGSERSEKSYEKIRDLMKSAFRAGCVAGRRKTNPRKGGTKMAKRKRKWGSPAQRAALKKMQAARRGKGKQLSLFKAAAKPHRKRRRKHHGGYAHAQAHGRRRTVTRTVTRVVTRTNPGIMATAKETLWSAIPAGVAGVGMGFLDTKILAGRSAIIRVGAKIGASVVAGLLLRKRPKMAFAAMGACLGTLGYEGGVRLGGGVIATSRVQGIKELAAMAGEDEEALGLLQEEMKGMGLLTETGADEPDLGDDMPDLGQGEEVAEVGDDDEVGDYGDEEEEAA